MNCTIKQYSYYTMQCNVKKYTLKKYRRRYPVTMPLFVDITKGEWHNKNIDAFILLLIIYIELIGYNWCIYLSICVRF